MDRSSIGRRAPALRAAAMLAVVLVAGCTVVEENRNLRAQEVRIDQKQVALNQEEAQQRQLRQRQQDLMRDLNNAKLSLDDLQRRIDELRAANARVAATTGQEQARQRRIDQELVSRRGEIGALNKRSDLPDAEKLKRIETLKRQIHDQLALQLSY